MQLKHVNLSRSIYTVSGSSLAFLDRGTLLEYARKKWGLGAGEITSFEVAVGDLESGSEVATFCFNDQEIKVLQRRIVTSENLDHVIERGW